MVEELLKIFETLIRNVDGALGKKIRSIYYKRRLGHCGKNVVIEVGVIFQSPKNIFISDNVWIDRYAILVAGKFQPRGRKFLDKENSAYKLRSGDLTLASGVHLSSFTLVQAHGGLSVGKNVTIAAGAKVYTLSHHYRNLLDPADQKRYSFSTMAPEEDQFLILSPVVIGDNCAVGLNAVLLPGTTLLEGSWLGVLSHVSPSETEAGSVYQSAKAEKK